MQRGDFTDSRVTLIRFKGEERQRLIILVFVVTTPSISSFMDYLIRVSVVQNTVSNTNYTKQGSS
jgi:hypothetical protein